MSRRSDEVLAEALQLPVGTRAALAGELISSLDGAEPSEDVEGAWAEEIRRRLAEIDAGTVSAVPWADAEQRILAAASGRE
jgi:putative addiction module component (TIGR02574 family)